MALPIDGNYKKSFLKPGDEIVVRNMEFETTGIIPDRIIYICDCPAGLVVECYFGKGNDRHYRRTINWSTVYAGFVQIKSADGDVKAEMKNKPEMLGWVR
jgi:hypothetical protein